MNLFDSVQRFDRLLWSSRADRDDLQALAADDREAQRFLLYREFVRSRLIELARQALPRTARALGAAFVPMIEDNLAARPPRTRFFRETALELADLEHPALAALPYTRDLARLELAVWRAGWVHAALPSVDPFALDRPVVVHPSLVRLEVAHAVHRTDVEPPPGTFVLAVYRRLDHVVETRWMDATLGRMLALWIEGAVPAIEAVRLAAEATGATLDGALLDRMSTLLSELIERGGVLGSAPLPAA